MSAIGAIGSYGSISGYYSFYSNRQSGSVGTQALERVTRAQTTPVPPVSETPAVRRGSPQGAEDLLPRGVQFPTLREGADPAEMAVRARIRYLEGEAEDLQQGALNRGQSPEVPAQEFSGKGNPEQLNGEEKDPLALQEEDEKSKTPQEVMEESECQTCKKRKYQDGSDDPGVSFKTATHIAPEQAASAVRGHEQEHVVREQAKAQREDRKVVSQSVTIHTAICPECGDVYVSGGTTRTTTMANPVEQPKPAEDDKKSGFEAVA